MRVGDYIKQFYREYRRRKELATTFPTLLMEKDVVIKGDIMNLKLGRNIIFQHGASLHLGGMDWCMNEGCIEMGDNSILSPYSVLYGAGPGGIHIGENFGSGPGVGIFASREDYKRGKGFYKFYPVEIGDNVMVCANAVVNTGVKIGNNVVICPNAFVNKDIPSGVVVAGNPAEIIKKID